jgi:hypothetical protein
VGSVKYVQEVKLLSATNIGRLVGSISSTGRGQAVASRVDKVALAVDIRGSHVVGITLDPFSLVQPRQNLLQESISVTLARVDTELGEPDRLVEGLVELGEVVLEVLDVGPGVVVGNDEVDLAVAAARHELLQVVDALVGISAVGNSR